MPGYGARYWAERTAVGKRRRYPALRGDETADVVVIGGGLTGATAAYVLAKGGLDVILVEGDRLASAGTAAGLGCVLPEPHVSFRAVEAAVGLRRARAAWNDARTSALDMAALLRRLSVRCDLAAAPVVTTAMTDEASGLLRREHAARKAAGLQAAWLSRNVIESTVGATVSGAIKQHGGVVFDPVRATLGIVRAAEEAGARVFEKSLVRKTTFTRQTADVVLKGGRIRTKGVFVATGAPGSLFRPLRRHVREEEGYVVVTEPLSSGMKREAGRRDSVVVEAGESVRCLRWLGDGRAMFAGADVHACWRAEGDPGAGAADGAVDVRVVPAAPGDFWLAGQVELAGPRGFDGRRPAVGRRPQELSLSFLCTCVRLAWRRSGVVRRRKRPSVTSRARLSGPMTLLVLEGREPASGAHAPKHLRTDAPAFPEFIQPFPPILV